MLALVVVFMTFVMKIGVTTQNQEGSGWMPTSFEQDFSNTTNSSSTGNEEKEMIDITRFSLPQFCQLSNLTETLCECPSVHPVMIQICRIFETINPTHIPIRCNSVQRHGILMVPLLILGIIGNSLVILVVKQQWRKSSNSQKLVGVLALPDILFLIVSFGNEMENLLTCQWTLGDFMCKAFSFGSIFTTTTALGFILIISIDRYYGIVHPFSLYITKKKIWIMITINIILSIAVALPVFFVSNSNTGTCSENWHIPSHSLIYSWVTFFVGFLLPILAISFFYVQILTKLRAAQSRIQQNLSERQQLQRRRENNRMALILACLVIFFFVLVLPNKIYWILQNYDVLEKLLTRNQYRIVKWVAFSAYVLHASINPLIYSIVDKRFRTNLKVIFCRCNKAKPEKRHQSPPVNNNGIVMNVEAV